MQTVGISLWEVGHCLAGNTEIGKRGTELSILSTDIYRDRAWLLPIYLTHPFIPDAVQMGLLEDSISGLYYI